jgi:hypothetical protein
MRNLVSLRVAALGAGIGGALLAVSGALQATGLDWTENAVETPAQHVTMALFALALAALVPAVAYIGRFAPGRGRLGWIGIAAGQLGVAAVGSIPLAIVGGGIVAGAYWLAVAYLLGLGARYRPALVQPSTL